MTSNILGATIVEIRPMTEEEMAKEGWTVMRNRSTAPAVVLSSGVVLYPSCDEKGNGPGVLFGVEPSGSAFAVN